MYRFVCTLFISLVLLVPLVARAATDGQVSADSTHLMAYTVIASARDAERLRREHFDISSVRGRVGNSLQLEVIMTEAGAEGLRAQGVSVTLNPGQAGGPLVRSFRSLRQFVAPPVFRTLRPVLAGCSRNSESWPMNIRKSLVSR